MPPVNVAAPAWLPQNRVNGLLGYLQQYTHNLNLIRWLLDEAQLRKRRSADFAGDGISGAAGLGMDGVRVSLEPGHLAYHGGDESTQVYFEHGRVKTAAPPLLLRDAPATVELHRAKPASQRSPAKRSRWSYKEEAQDFVNCVLEDRPFDASGEDTLADVQACEDIFRTWLTPKGEIV